MMKKIIGLLSVLLIAIMVTGCYHAQFTTDKEPSNQVIEKPWASSFVFGLVPPSVVETAEQCPNGVARVESKISFLNGLVAGLTFNIYTPMNLKVTCAAESSAALLPNSKLEIMKVNKNASATEKQELLVKAVQKSLATGKAVTVDFK